MNWRKPLEESEVSAYTASGYPICIEHLVWSKHWVICINSFNAAALLWGSSYHYSLFTDRKLRHRVGRWTIKIIELINNRALIWSQVVWLQNPHAWPHTKLRNKHKYSMAENVCCAQGTGKRAPWWEYSERKCDMKWNPPFEARAF